MFDKLLHYLLQTCALSEFQSCLSDEVLFNTGDDCHKQSALLLTSSMHHEFPTILSTTEIELTQNVCPCGLCESVIVLFGIPYATLGAIIWAEILQ